MVHDLFANFYCTSDDREPKYRCPIGLFSKGEDFLLGKGFTKSADPYYQDYEKEVSETELEDWVQEDYVSEVMDIIYSGEDFERILLEALLLEPIDDKGTLPGRIVQLNDITVNFSCSAPWSFVIFQEPIDEKRSKTLIVTLYSLKKIFNVLTLMEVMSKLQELGESQNWTFEQWKQYIKENELTLQL